MKKEFNNIQELKLVTLQKKYGKWIEWNKQICKKWKEYLDKLEKDHSKE